MSDNPKHVTVRLRVPPELRDKIAESSERYNRSMNADMVARLEESFKVDGKTPIFLSESNKKELNSFLAITFGTLIIKLIKQGVDPSKIENSFPDADVFKEMVATFNEIDEKETAEKIDADKP